MSYRITTENRASVLARGVGMLETLALVRERTNNPTFGYVEECVVVNEMLFDLEASSSIEDVDKRVADAAADNVVKLIDGEAAKALMRIIEESAREAAEHPENPFLGWGPQQ